MDDTTALVAQTKELESLDEFAAERGFEGQLQPWDVPYWRRKQRASLFQYEEGEIREFLPLPRVLQVRSPSHSLKSSFK